MNTETETHVMLDLETFGSRPGCIIAAIGAVKFNATEILGEFYQRIDLQSCVDRGLFCDMDTILWWLKQSDTARAEMTNHEDLIPLDEALCRFSFWLQDSKDDPRVWGNGASFDNAVLAAACHACRVPLPWKFWHERCYRTMKAQFPSVPLQRSGTHHHALDDARSQSLHLQAIWRHLAQLENPSAMIDQIGN